MSWGVSAAVHALETAMETALPAEAEAVTYPPSVIEEAPSASPAPSVPAEPIDVLLPRRRPTVPPPPVPGDTAPGGTAPRDTALGATAAGDTASRHDGTIPAEPAAPQPARTARQAPDLAVLDQVLRGLQRMA